ncbi:hypothetical protein Tco_0024075 [Tanacetum coccineum]
MSLSFIEVRVSSCASLLSLPERLKADNTIMSEPLPTEVLFDVDIGRISIRHCETKEYHFECSAKITSKGKRLLGPIGGSGGEFERGLGGNVGSCGGNGGRGRSISERGGGSLAKLLMESKREYLDGWVGAGGGEVKGGGVDFRVSRTLLGEIPEEIIGESGG